MFGSKEQHKIKESFEFVWHFMKSSPQPHKSQGSCFGYILRGTFNSFSFLRSSHVSQEISILHVFTDNSYTLT